MTLRSYIWGMRIVVLFSVLALMLTLNYIDPETSGIPGKVLFFLVLFFMLSGIFNLLLLRFRKNMTTSETAMANINLSFRQGMLLSIFCLGILWLQGMDMLVWWDALIVLAGIFLIELFFITKK